MVRSFILAACLSCVAPAAWTQSFEVPEGCEAFLTVQMRGCGASVFWRCEADPTTTWELHADGEGPFSLSLYDAEYQWLNTLIYIDGSTERLIQPADDPASLSELLDTGLDSYDFKVEEFGAEETRTVRYTGYDKLTGETVTIDGVDLLQTEFQTTAVDAGTGEEVYRVAGNQFVLPDERLFFSGTDIFVQGDLTDEGDLTPVQFIQPGAPGFGKIEPLYECDEPTDISFNKEVLQ